MAFTSTVLKQTVFGDLRVVAGTYVNTSGSTGGDIATGLTVVGLVTLQPYGAAVGSAPFVNETLGAIPATACTIVTNANESGIWMAYGI